MRPKAHSKTPRHLPRRGVLLIGTVSKLCRGHSHFNGGTSQRGEMPTHSHGFGEAFAMTIKHYGQALLFVFISSLCVVLANAAPLSVDAQGLSLDLPSTPIERIDQAGFSLLILQKQPLQAIGVQRFAQDSTEYAVIMQFLGLLPEQADYQAAIDSMRRTYGVQQATVIEAGKRYQIEPTTSSFREMRVIFVVQENTLYQLDYIGLAP